MKTVIFEHFLKNVSKLEGVWFVWCGMWVRGRKCGADGKNPKNTQNTIF
jgi:hypothetical protein